MKSLMSAKKEKLDTQEEIKMKKEEIGQNLSVYNKNLEILARIDRTVALEKEATEVKCKDLAVLNPNFGFEKLKEWETIHEKIIRLNADEKIEAMNGNGDKLRDQNKRIAEHYKELVERLKELGADVSEYEGKTPAYFG